MKLKNTIISFISIAAAAFSFVACNVEDAVQFPVIATKQAVYEAPVEGGEVAIALSSNVSWTASVAPATSRDNVDDVTLSIVEGSAATKELKVNFGANAGFNRGAIVTFTSRDVSAAVTINQPGAKGELIEEISIADFLAKSVDASIYYQISGTVTKIAQSNKYSNFYLADETGEVYVYGLYDGKGGTQFTDGWLDNHGVKVGYTMTLGATRGQYNTTIEAMYAYVIDYAAPTTPVMSMETTAASVLATDQEAKFSLTAMNLKSDWKVTPAESYDWITDYTKSGRESGDIVISFTQNEDTESARVASFTISNADCESIEITLTQAKKLTAGSLDTPFTVSQAIDFCSTLTGATTEEFYVKGIVSKIQSDFSEQYGNGIFWISEDGSYGNAETPDKYDTSKDFEVYQTYWFDGAKWVEGNSKVSVGDEVIVVGKLTCYKGTCETSGKNSHIYSVNGVTADGQGLGSEAYPLTVKGARDYCEALGQGNTSTLDLYVSGTISSVKYKYDATHNTANFNLSDDGSAESDQFIAYSIYAHKDGSDWVEGTDPQVEVGDKALICGKLTNYKGTLETASKKAWIVSITKAGASE